MLLAPLRAVSHRKKNVINNVPYRGLDINANLHMMAYADDVKLLCGNVIIVRNDFLLNV